MLRGQGCNVVLYFHIKNIRPLFLTGARSHSPSPVLGTTLLLLSS